MMANLTMKIFFGALAFVGITSAFTIQNADTRYTEDDVGVPLSELRDSQPGMFADVVSHFSSIKKRAVGTAVTEFSMDGDTDSQIQWDVLDPGAEQESYESKTAFGVQPGVAPTCPTTVSEGLNDPLHMRSTCPWYYVARHDPNRFPTTILMAVSPCNTCIGSNGMHECVGITRKSTVLTKATTPELDGSYKWTESEFTTTVGFTCAGRRLTDNTATQDPVATTPLYE